MVMTARSDTQVPRSILKKPSSQSTSIQSPSDAHRETAIYHANLLQQRKDAEYAIFCSTEALLELPSAPDSDPAKPIPEDAQFVQDSLKLFQPADYDALIEERNINRQCGYVLCPRPNRQEDTKAKFRILRGKDLGQEGLRIVKKEQLERWCSDDCGRRALFIRLQLNEEPAWAREPTIAGNIALLGQQGNTNESETLVSDLESLQISRPDEEVLQKLQDLALERENGGDTRRAAALAEVEIREQHSDGNARPSSPEPVLNRFDDAHTIEGYRSTISDHANRASKIPTDDEGEDDIIDVI